MAPNAEDIIDVDDWTSESDTSDIVLTGFKRDPTKSKSHTEELDTAGVVFIGFHSQAGQQPKPPTSSIRTAKQDKPDTKHTRGLTVKAPPSRTRSHEPSTTNPHLKRPREVIAISDSDDDEPVPKKPTPTKRVRSSRNTTQAPYEPPVVEDLMQLDEVESEEDPYDYTVPDIDSEQLWTQPKKRCETPLDIRDEDARLGAEQLDIDFEKCSLNDHGGRHGFHRTLRQQRQSPLLLDRSHTGQLVAYRQPHVHSILQHVRPMPLRTRWTPWRNDFLTWSGFRHWPPGRPIRKAPKDINTIVQCNGLVVMASAVSEGNADDIPGPENRAGALAVWANGTEHILEAHSTDFVPESGFPRKHHLTVNDVAIDPACPTRFVSVGRDRRVRIWDCAEILDGGMPRRVRDFECQENPEVVRYHPLGSTFAVQCDDGSVTLHRDSTRKLEIPASEEDHVTADMIWGYGGSDNYLFASSSSTPHSDTASGRHKAFDAVRCKCVVEFDASNNAGNCLALDPLGLQLFAATETTDGTFFLRQFDAHRRARAPVQQLELEPFRHMPSRAEMNVNALAVSPDGLHIAVGRSDNWADVYDSRMLSRGMLYSFAHEGDPGGDAYGVVKAQWVDGPPFGAGLVTGGIEGCVRLWDLRRTSEDPLNGTILAQCDYDVGTFSLGDPYKDEVPLIVGEKSGLVTFWGQAASQDEDERPHPPIFLS